jgi:hypothetical protein
MAVQNLHTDCGLLVWQDVGGHTLPRGDEAPAPVVAESPAAAEP